MLLCRGLQLSAYISFIRPDTFDLSMQALPYTLLSRAVIELHIASIVPRTALVSGDCDPRSLRLGQLCSQTLRKSWTHARGFLYSGVEGGHAT